MRTLTHIRISDASLPILAGKPLVGGQKLTRDSTTEPPANLYAQLAGGLQWRHGNVVQKHSTIEVAFGYNFFLQLGFAANAFQSRMSSVQQESNSERVARFNSSLSQLIDRIADDRYVLAVALVGSLTEETIWRRGSVYGSSKPTG